MEMTDVILGFLDWKPLTGYELKGLFAKLDFLPWSGNNNQIYTALMALEKQGMVEKQVVPQENLPAQKRYSISPSGRESLKKAVLCEAEQGECRSDILLQLSWANCLDDDELRGVLGAYERRLQDALLMSEEQQRRAEVRVARSAREEYLWQMIAQHRIDRLRCEVNWLGRLKNGLAKKGEEGHEERRL